MITPGVYLSYIAASAARELLKRAFPHTEVAIFQSSDNKRFYLKHKNNTALPREMINFLAQQA